jgi:hypothetical protein
MEYSSGRSFSSARVWMYAQYTVCHQCFIALTAYQRKMLPNTQPANNLKNCWRFMIHVGAGRRGLPSLCRTSSWKHGSYCYFYIILKYLYSCRYDVYQSRLYSFLIPFFLIIWAYICLVLWEKSAVSSREKMRESQTKP